jgi:hypothetical protein
MLTYDSMPLQLIRWAVQIQLNVIHQVGHRPFRPTDHRGILDRQLTVALLLPAKPVQQMSVTFLHQVQSQGRKLVSLLGSTVLGLWAAAGDRTAMSGSHPIWRGDRAGRD